MFTFEVVKCTTVAHKIRCLGEVRDAIKASIDGNDTHRGRKVTIRGGITDPCTCHLEAAIFLACNGYELMGGSIAYMNDDARDLEVMLANGCIL